MKKSFGVVLFLALMAISAYGQDTLWTRNYGYIGASDQGMCGCLMSDGGFIVAGYSVNFPGGDVYVVRADANGDTLWTRNFGGDRWQQANNVIETSDGGAIIAGKFSFAVGDYDMYVIRLDSNGDSLWTRRYGMVGDDDGQAVIELSDGNFLAVGYGRNAGTTDLFMVKIDTLGNPIWQRYHGGSGSDYGYGVVELADGGFMITGSNGSGTIGLSDLWLLRTDSSGFFMWERKFDYHVERDRGDGIVQADNGDFVIGGRTFIGNYAQLLALRVDSLGNQLWARQFGVVSDGEFAESIDKTLDGGFVIGGGKGYTTFDFYVVRINSNGDSLWASTYNGATGRSDDCYEIRVNNEGDIFAFGYTDIAPAAPSDLQLWAIKINDSAFQGGDPEIDIDPLAFTDTIMVDSASSQELYISNVGTAILNFGLHGDQTWIGIIPDTGFVAISGTETVTVNFSAVGLTPGDYTGQININSDDTSESVITVPVSLVVTGGSGGCAYLPGDINGNGATNGIDVTYGVIYFKGGAPPPVDCGGICPESSPFYAAGDVNANCVFNGIDVTFFVNYLKGIVPALLYCPDCSPAP